MALQKHHSRFLVCLPAGILFATAFPKFNFPVLAWLAPGVVVWLAHNRSGKRVLLSGFLSGLGCWLVMMYWLLMIPFRLYGLGAYLVQSAVGATCMGTWCWLCWRLWPPRNRAAGDLRSHWAALTSWERLRWPVLCAAAWVVTELILARFLPGFPGFLGASQFRWLALIQISNSTGVYGVSFLISWLSVSLFCAALALWSDKERFCWPVIQLVPPLLALAGVLIYGRHELLGAGETAKHYKIALVQPAIPQSAIWDPNEKTNRFLKLLHLSQAALAEKPNLLVWPETALPEMIARNQFTQDAVANLLRPYKSWMVLGAADYDPVPGVTGQNGMQWYNSAFLINPAGDMAGRYHKRHLVPFGEFMPGARLFPFLARLRAAGAGLTSGNSPGLFHMTEPPANCSVLICYEDLFPDEVRECLTQETDFLLNLTNDAWFGDSAAQWLHLVNALFRSVELRLPLVRCCNNGISCWIDALGRLHNVDFPNSTNVYQSGYKLIDVPLAGSEAGYHPTFYRQFGDLFAWSCVILVAFFAMKPFGLRRSGESPTSAKAPRREKRKMAKQR
ncbi:MAG TPA: apolipoprotein N-acyltransferase [Candidatus Limnocylindrales bacterium]|jgi:apolipoprotein N-acyltransferase|nr:apolipoprotein N-acyltransferase [Candidatus Limnocylindrales bacterium]